MSIPPSLGTLSIMPETQPTSEQGMALHRGLEDLATELRDQILQYLDLDAIKSIRLTSSKWALLGRRYLLDPNFEAMPHRDDLQRLLEISQHPYFSSRVEQITIRLTNVNDQSLRSNLCHTDGEYEGPEALQSAWAEFSKCEGLQEIFKDDFLNPQIVRSVFPDLKNLEAVHIKTQECWYNHPLLQSAWTKPSTRCAPGYLEIIHFITILHATANSKLRTLSHDGLPHKIWGFCQVLAPTFSGLATLKLSIHCQTMCMDFTKELSDCLKTAPNLEELCLGFQGSTLPVGFNFSLLDGFVWQHLHTLALEHLGWQAADFGPFLSAHAATLRRLRISALSNYRQFYGDFVDNPFMNSPTNLKDLLKEMKSNLKLEKLDVRGHAVFDYQPRATLLACEKGIYDDNWEPIEDEAGKPLSMSCRCEEYVIRNGLSPFAELLVDEV